MATTTCTQIFRIYFCGDSKTTDKETVECCSLIAEPFGNASVFLSSPSPFLSEEDARITRATELLSQSILQLHNCYKGKEAKKHPQRFILFTYGEGMKVVDLTLKKLLGHNIDIHVYSFGKTPTLIFYMLARKVHHYIFQDHLTSQDAVLSRMHSIIQDVVEQEEEKSLSRYDTDFFNCELMDHITKYERYFDSYSVTFLDKSDLEPSYDETRCEFLAYAQVIQEIAYAECNL
ncbi:MAG: hypothetical protein H7A41_06960 [Chlamydiales bacterium]|nr:hypothetical protein [Chlamydiales bacterium]